MYLYIYIGRVFFFFSCSSISSSWDSRAKKYASNVLDITNKPLQLLKFEVLSVPIKKALKLFPSFFFSPLSYDQLSVHPPEHDGDDNDVEEENDEENEDGDGGNVDGHKQGDGELTKLAPWPPKQLSQHLG